MWVEHPACGAPFIDEHCTLTTSARSILADAVEPGTDLAADTRSAFPPVSAVPGPGSGQSAFGCLSDFAGGWFAIESPTAAVEPANVIPGDPSPGCPERGQAPILAGLATWTSAITLARTSL
jgi:hypothetical protein